MTPQEEELQKEFEFRAKEAALLALTRPPMPIQDDGLSSEDEEEYEIESTYPEPNDENGAICSNYKWGQTLEDITIDIPIGVSISSKMLDLDVSDDGVLIVKAKGELIFQAELSHAIEERAFQWTIEDNGKAASDKFGRCLSFYFTKINQFAWWDSAFKGHPKININKIQAPEGKLDKLDNDTRRMVEKLMFDQRQQAQGKPTSEQLEKMALFEKFKAMHPEMDFSNADITY